ncbi:MAG: PKD domain-containing protein, partial [Bacteroidia bacterium]
TLDVLVVPMPSPDLVIEPVLCINEDYTLGNNSGGPSADFEWTILDATTLDTIWFSTEFSPTINLSQPGSYLLRLNAISPYGCSVETETDFIVVTPPVPQFALSADTACAPYQVGINNTSSGYQVSYEWDFGTLFPLSFDEVPALPVFPSPIWGDSLYFVQLSLTNLCGTRTVLDSVVVRPQPVAVLGTDYSQACSPATFMLQNASYGSPSSFQWDFGNGTTSTDSLPASISYTAQNITASYLIQLTASNSCGTDIDSAEVFILPSNIQLSALLPQEACAPFTLSFSSPLVNQSYYLWDFGDGNGGIGESILHTYTTPGVYTLELFVSNFCFTDSAETVITINEGPQMALSVSESIICQNSTVSVSNTSVNAASVEWFFNGAPQNGNATVQNFTLTQSGANIIALAGVNPLNGCRDTVEATVEAAAFPIMDISVTPDTGCFPLQVTFLNQTTGANAWEWSFEDGTGSSEQEPSLLIENLGSFDAQLIAHNYVSFDLDCPDTASISAWVHPSPVSSFSLSALDGCGPPAEVNTINQSQSAVSQEWNWEGNVSTELAPTLAFADTGLKVISLTVFNAFGCPDSSTAAYRVFGQPVIDFDLLPAAGCPPLEVVFDNQTQYADSVSWGFGDGNFAQGYTSSHVYENTGFYPLQVYMSTGNGRCWADTMLAEAIQVYPRAISDFVVTPPVVTEGIPTFTFDNSSSGFNALELYFDTLFLVDELPVMFTLAEPDTGSHYFMLVANNEFNCPDTSYQEVYVKPEPTFFFPNSFTPNGDGRNDKFRIYFEKAPEIFWVNIYNRWGQLIFTSTDPEEEWDGTYLNKGGAIVEDEVYVLKFSAIIEGTVVNSRLFYNVTVIH